MTTEKLEFQGHDGSTLAARLDLPAGRVRATALFAHCFTCSKDILPARRIAQRLTAAGIAVLRFDFTGLGHSEGEFANTTFTSNVEDLVRAAETLRARDLAPTLLIGHSLGGAAVLRAAGEIGGIKAVVTLGAPFAPDHVTHNFADHLDEITREGAAEVDLGGRTFTIGRAFVEDIRAETLTAAIHNLKAALLIMHAPRDTVVGIDNAEAIFRAAIHPKSFVTLDDADHLLSRGEDAEYAASVIAAWAGRYLDLGEAETREGAPEGVLRVQEADPEGYLQDVTQGPHHLYADEPVSFGGTNRGLSPYGFLAAGLGACTSMTIRMYARRKKWPLTDVRVDVTHSKVHAEDADPDTPSGKVDEFRRMIRLAGDLTEEQRDRLIEIADKCPVHKTLHQENRIVTERAD
ncbi:bifunctional alpha/beta hydrolase/OsmC family protein [Maritimibacter sp. UBA3975]|uniref:bifunctional alpha/beta hydrolase/OsmC family protein n=1 Tax=Maritimibacter sp. UBA3975 TaxID=1946833 RepID=UPI000C0A1070|nr:bifunctional alpha/beta hydrolase/OsmC family protein [Maritimibacter sp. UBA3975]MAM61172.1 osmotically inducible protein C [Maritimibacter sp.]|tara:strand:+ start:2117 stop:3331 length:1215 start_codon:yes stop_codon:yes gene_type:complete